MFLLWLIVLSIYGAFNGFGTIPTLCWLLLIPFFFQDLYDENRKKSLKNILRTR